MLNDTAQVARTYCNFRYMPHMHFSYLRFFSGSLGRRQILNSADMAALCEFETPFAAALRNHGAKADEADRVDGLVRMDSTREAGISLWLHLWSLSRLHGV